MNATLKLHDLGQSIWLDNITREMLSNGTLKRYIEGLPAIEEAIFAGIPVNVTLLFSTAHYLAAAHAYLRGIERRIAAGLKADVASVASLFVSRWDTAVAGKVPAGLNNRLGIAMA